MAVFLKDEFVLGALNFIGVSLGEWSTGIRPTLRTVDCDIAIKASGLDLSSSDCHQDMGVFGKRKKNPRRRSRSEKRMNVKQYTRNGPRMRFPRMFIGDNGRRLGRSRAPFLRKHLEIRANVQTYAPMNSVDSRETAPFPNVRLKKTVCESVQSAHRDDAGKPRLFASHQVPW
jgi:hypothetical protein